MNQVYEVTDTITVLRNGEYVGTYETDKLPKVELVGKMIGKDYAELSNKLQADLEDALDGELFADFNKVCGLGTLQDIDLSIKYGEVLGLSGLLGSGRSEIARMIFGIDKIEKGNFEIKGIRVKLKSTLEAIREGVAFCPENRKTEGIVGELTVKENIILALQAKKGMTLYIGSDNEKIGKQAGEEITQLLMNKVGTVLELSGSKDSQSDLDRSKGFEAIITEYSGIETIQYRVETATRDDTEDMVLGLGNQLNGIDAIFAHNDYMARGAYLALQQLGFEIPIIGIDGFIGENNGVSMVQNDEIAATIT